MKQNDPTKLKISKISATQIAVQAGIDKESSNGDIFQLTRDVQDDALDQGLEIANTMDLYNWLTEFRNEQRKSRKGVRNKG